MRTRHLPRPLRSLLAASAVALLVVGAAACGDDDDPTDTAGTDTTEADDATATGGDDYGGTGDDAGETAAGTIVAKDFSLTDVTVGPGDEIVLENQGEAPHTATADDGAFDLGQVPGGDTSEPANAPSEPGTYPFHCELHPQMTATLTVEG